MSLTEGVLECEKGFTKDGYSMLPPGLGGQDLHSEDVYEDVAEYYDSAASLCPSH